MSFKEWEEKVLEAPGAPERVAEVEDELRLAAGLTALREKAGLSQRDLAARLGVSQPRVAAIERADNLTIDVLDQYVVAVGGELEVLVRHGGERFPLVGAGAARHVKRHESGRLVASGRAGKAVKARKQPARRRRSGET